MSRSKRTLASNEVATIISQSENNIRLPLFIKKSDDEGQAHYYIGDLKLIDGSPQVKYMPSGDGKQVSVVNMHFEIDKPVDSNLYNFLTNSWQRPQAKIELPGDFTTHLHFIKKSLCY